MAAAGEGTCARAEKMVDKLRNEHTIKNSQPLPAKSTVGIVMDGTEIKAVVPQSPASKEYGGQHIEPGDVVTHIDGVAITAKDVATRLIGDDRPGQVVKIAVTKGGEGGAPAEFPLTRAEMGSVIFLKDLFMKIATLREGIEDGVAHEGLLPMLHDVEEKIASVTDYQAASDKTLRDHVTQLEGTYRQEALACDKLAASLKEAKAQGGKEGGRESGDDAGLSRVTSGSDALRRVTREAEENKVAKQQAEARMNELEAEREEMKQALNSLKASDKEAASSKLQLERFQRDAKQQFERMQQELEAARAREKQLRAEAEATILDLRDQLAASEQEVQEGKERERRIRGEVESMSDKAKQNAERAAADKAAGDERDRTERDRRARVERQLQELQGSETMLQRTVEQLEKELKLQNAAKEKTGLETQAALEAEAARTKDAMRQGEALKEEVRQLKSDLNAMEFAMNSAKQKAATVQQQLAEAEQRGKAASAELDTTRVRVREAAEREAALAAHLEEVQATVEGRERHLQAKVRAATREGQDYKKAADSLREERKVLRDATFQQQSEIVSLKTKSAEEEALEVKVAALEERLKEEKDDKKDLQDRLRQAEAKARRAAAAPAKPLQSWSGTPRGQDLEQGGAHTAARAGRAAEVAELPFLNPRTDDIGKTAAMALLFLGIAYWLSTMPGVGGQGPDQQTTLMGMGVVLCAVFGMAFSLLLGFKGLIYLCAGDISDATSYKPASRSPAKVAPVGETQYYQLPTEDPDEKDFPFLPPAQADVSPPSTVRSWTGGARKEGERAGERVASSSGFRSAELMLGARESGVGSREGGARREGGVGSKEVSSSAASKRLEGLGLGGTGAAKAEKEAEKAGEAGARGKEAGSALWEGVKPGGRESGARESGRGSERERGRDSRGSRGLSGREVVWRDLSAGGLVTGGAAGGDVGAGAVRATGDVPGGVPAAAKGPSAPGSQGRGVAAAGGKGGAAGGGKAAAAKAAVPLKLV